MKKRVLHKAVMAAFVISLIGVSSVAEAQRAMPRVEDRAQGRAKNTRNAEKLVPYGQIARKVTKRFGGRVVGQNVKDVGGRIIYDLRVLKPDGRVVFVMVDAQSGKILRTRGE